MRSDWLLIERKQSISSLKESLVANLMALSMRRGSSWKVMFGSKGVLMIPLSKSPRPLNGSINSPKFSGWRSIANAFIVKSLLY